MPLHAVRAADLKILLYLLATIFVMCVLTYHSAVAAAMLLVPLLFAQFATDSVMYLRGVGLDVNTLPVIADNAYDVERLRGEGDIVVNLLSDVAHPCQAL